MKKAINKALLIFWFSALLSAIIMLSGCKSLPIESKHTVEHIKETKIDSTSTIRISQAIQDSLIVKINQIKTAKPECDSVTNQAIKQVLQRLNNAKKSGNNEFGIFYDELQNQVVIYADLKESIEKDLQTNRALIESLKDQNVQTITVKVYPKWLVWLAVFGGCFILFLVWRFSKIFM